MSDTIGTPDGNLHLHRGEYAVEDRRVPILEGVPAITVSALYVGHEENVKISFANSLWAEVAEPIQIDEAIKTNEEYAPDPNGLTRLASFTDVVLGKKWHIVVSGYRYSGIVLPADPKLVERIME